MKPIQNFSTVNEATDMRKTLPAGGYVLEISNVEDVEDKEYLALECDIAEGEWKDYGVETEEATGYYPFVLKPRRSYRQKALPFFKRFLRAIEDSGNGFRHDELVKEAESANGLNEQKLVGKKFGAVLGEEQYRKNNGDIGTRLYVDREMPVSRIREGDFTVPELKRLPGMDPVFKPYSEEKDQSTMTDEEFARTFG